MAPAARRLAVRFDETVSREAIRGFSREPLQLATSTRSRVVQGADYPHQRSVATCANALGERFRYTFIMA